MGNVVSVIKAWEACLQGPKNGDSETRGTTNMAEREHPVHAVLTSGFPALHHGKCSLRNRRRLKSCPRNGKQRFRTLVNSQHGGKGTSGAGRDHFLSAPHRPMGNVVPDTRGAVNHARWVMAPALLFLISFALLWGLGKGQDFDLSDALDDPGKPTAPPKKPPAPGGDLDLSDALGGDDPAPPAPRPRPKPDRDARPSGGDFSITDLEDAAGGRGGGGGPRAEEPEAGGPAPQGLVPGLIAAAVAAIAGAVSSFVAYRKGRCFRERGSAPV